LRQFYRSEVEPGWSADLDQDPVRPLFSGGCVDASGNVYLAGGYYSSNYYVYLLKLDTSGTLQWQRSLNGSAQEYSAQ